MITKYIFFCPWCGKYHESFGYCPFCRRQTYGYDFWKNATEDQRKAKMEETKDNMASENFYSEKEIKEAEKFDQEYHAKLDAELAEAEARKQYVPKCPTCGCPDIEKISAGAKAADVALFGLWGSNKRKLQFRCKNCGYEW